MESLLKRLPVVAPALSPALEEVHKVSENIIAPLFSRITKYLEQTLLSIHKEDFGG
jgi:hypothetical protein